MRPVPSIGIVLGSGFGGVRREMTEQRSWSYAELPGFPVGTVPGHECRLLWGTLGGVPVVVLSGRAHYYEGFDLDQVTYPVRVLAALGLKVLLLTNASGGIRAGLRPGDFMAISDHINFLGANPLRGVQRQSHFGLKGAAGFTDLTEAYDPELRQILRSAGRAAGVRVKQGVYLAVSGPSYETPAEIRAFGRWGADAVGMSTVAETIVARHCGLRVAGLSGVTNLAAGRGGKGVRLSHEDVLAQAQSRETAASRLVLEFVKKCSQHLIGTQSTDLA
jgi:inosine/guanosine/xanthosine phosphorylase family protein